jgi:hypothetical protein
MNSVLIHECASLRAQWPITKLAQNKYNTDNTQTNNTPKKHTQKKTKNKQVVYNNKKQSRVK